MNITEIRQQFPSLNQPEDDIFPVFLDNPAGTQVPQRVIDAVSDYYINKNANAGGAFTRSRATDALVKESRQVLADFVNAPRPEEIVFGPNMTSLNFALSRAIAQTLPDDAEIVITRMDHDANIAPWLAVARDRNLQVHWVDINTDDGTLDMDSLEAVLSEKTQIVAAVHASNALGTINQVQQIASMAHAVDALFIMDAVQSAPHVALDVQLIGCDVLLCSAYKFFGPHIGVMWGRYDLLEQLPAYKVRPAKDVTPYRWETGTPSFETIAGTAEAVRYIESLGDASLETRRLRLESAYTNIQTHEAQLSARLIDGLQAIPQVTMVGITDKARLHQRVATISFTYDGYTPVQVADYLAQQKIQVWDGDYYAVEVMQRLGHGEQGMVRVGAAHYNTLAEIDRFLNVLDDLS